MKILMVGEAVSNSGYCKALHSYALALDSVGHDVVIRNVSMTSPKGALSQKIKDFLNKNVDNVDFIFQFNLPTEFAYVDNGTKQAVGYAYETNTVPKIWQPILSQFKNVVIPCQEQGYGLKQLGCQPWAIPHAIDTDQFNKQYPQLMFGGDSLTHRFYTIGEFNKRKNVGALIAGYLSAFTSSDNVSLVLKCHVPGLSPDHSKHLIKQNVKDIKQSLGRFSNEKQYPNICIIGGFLSDEEIAAIHNSCDTFVSTSKGEAFGIPAFDAYGFGNNLILSQTGSYNEYFKNSPNVSYINGHYDQCVVGQESLKGLYTTRETWFNASIKSTAEALINAFRKGKEKHDGEMVKAQFNYQTIGNKFQELLNA